MPRVANLPRADSGQAASPPKQSPLKIPLNDDRREKAVRHQSRQALHDLQINQIKAAASPVRRDKLPEHLVNKKSAHSRTQLLRNTENDEDIGSLTVVPETALTPMKRMPILANFEEWMKMATDNKINATNSWSFALIDYFHDMSLLKEGDGVNFQKASCTLDGCVKIYTSRVDSVATETGKLLSGLAESGNKKDRQHGGMEAEDGNLEDEEGDEYSGKVAKKRGHRAFEATLVPSFTFLSLKKFELEFSVDPLFKKASADFDEGGAKGLLLNHLAIDGKGRIVFDSSEDTESSVFRNGNEEKESETSTGLPYTPPKDGVEHILPSNGQTKDTDLSILATKFFQKLDRLDAQDLCPSLKLVEVGEVPELSNSRLLTVPENEHKGEDRVQLAKLDDKSGIFLDDDNAIGFDDDNEPLEGFQLATNTGFGEGGEAWARDAALEPKSRPQILNSGDNIVEISDTGDGNGIDRLQATGTSYTMSFRSGIAEGDHGNILSYFDNALQKSWAGPEHWRIRRLKGNTKSSTITQIRRKDKEPFEIDFTGPLEPALAESIYTPANSESVISLPKTQRISKTRNLLPDDKNFNSRHLVQLFLKPRARIGTSEAVKSNCRTDRYQIHEEMAKGDVDKAFWAQRDVGETHINDFQNANPRRYDADFFQDDGLGATDSLHDDHDGNFTDAQEILSASTEHTVSRNSLTFDHAVPADSRDGRFGSQLVTHAKRLRPDYVQYARVAKKVDVRRLKEELWKGFGFEENPQNQVSPVPSAFPAKDTQPKSFTFVMNGLQQVYHTQAMAEISTSYCFICLLHLANEKGLYINDDSGLEDLKVQRDLEADIA